MSLKVNAGHKIWYNYALSGRQLLTAEKNYALNRLPVPYTEGRFDTEFVNRVNVIGVFDLETK